MDVENLAKELILKNMTPEQQMAVLDSVRQSVSQAKEVQKRKIGENVDLVIQALKKIESDIRSRFDDVGNAIEKRVSTIKDGRDGINGKDGRDGKDGRNGKDGAKGDRGERGQDGRDGSDGSDGVSVSNARIDFDGSLIITLSTGVELNVGEVVAPDLAERIKVITNGGGTSQSVLDTLTSLQSQITAMAGFVNYEGTWNASTNIPTLTSSVGTKGDYYVVSTTGTTNLNGITTWTQGDWAIFNGSAWEKVDNTDLVTSVAGRTGAVVLTQTDVSGTASLTTTQTLTNKTLTSPIINEILDSNGNEILGLSTTASATDFLTVKNGIGVGVPLHVYADGSSSNIGLHIQPKGTGLVTISDGTDFNKGIRFRSSSSSASAVTLIDAVSTAGRVVTLPDATDTLVGRATADTLTNKTLTSPTLTTPVLGTPASGNLANCTFPTLNQNTTGSAATLTTGRTIAITGDLAYTSPSFDGSTNVTAAGTLATVNTNVGSFTNASVTVNGKGLVTAASSGTAPVTSVTGTSPVASSGGATPAISLSAGYGDTLNPYASKTANYFLAAPNGSAGVPTFRAVVAADIPTLNQNTTGTAASTPKLLTTNFTIEESGGKLLFKNGATTIASMSSTGIITSAANIVANGTP